MACINPNSPEFKSALDRIGNPLLAEIDVDGVNYTLKATNLLQSPKADQFFNAVAKNKISGDFFWKKMQADLGIPKEQIEFLKQYNTTDRNELITNILADYSYAIEINTSMASPENQIDSYYSSFDYNGKSYTRDRFTGEYWFTENGKTTFIDKDEFNKASAEASNNTTSSYYSNLTVPGGTNYTENEIATPAITPSIKGHAQFATDQGIGWFRSDDRTKGGKYYKEFLEASGIENPTITGLSSKTRRILEVQSDLFQKGRDSSQLSKERTTDSERLEYLRQAQVTEGLSGQELKEFNELELKESSKGNQFLQLLNQGSNWVTFFVKSIIQDSAKKGYEKVLFPSGNTASKVEGHQSLEEFKKQKEDRIKSLEQQNELLENVKTEKIDPTILSEKAKEKFYSGELQKEKIENANSGIEKNNKEIDTVKQELDRLEKEGFGALRPIYNFYENTVANILKKQGYSPKQVTDEYGNTWNEINIVPEREQQAILFQTQGLPASKSSAETIKKIKEAAKQMGIDIQDLADYAKQAGLNINSVNGVADLARGVVAVALGREDVALGEELVHIASAIIEQVNPDLMTQMIKEIGKYKIYKQVFDEYKNNKYYQLPDGKPDIRKIKKEAVDKLIYEKIVLQSEGNTEFPSLLEMEERNVAQRLWNAILDFVKSLYNKTNVDLFGEAATQIIEGRVGGTTADIVGADIFLQIDNDNVNKIYDTIVDRDNRLVLNPKTAEDKRHYLFDGKRVALSVTEKIKGKNDNERSEFDKKQDGYKQDWGLAGHGFIENTLKNNLLDIDGYAKAEFTDTPLDTELNSTIQKGIRSYLEDLVRSYSPGTRFLVERMAVNEKGKMIASTIDLIAIEPVVKEDGTKDVKVDVYDWKFTNFDKTTNDDIPFYKQDEWKAQMGEYTKMLYNYGVQPNQLRRTRMIPFIANYDYAIKGDRDSKLILKSLEIGKFDSLKETKLYLLPVALDTESTNKKKVDELVQSLKNQWSKLYKKSVGPEEKFQKNIQLNELSKAIRFLHMKLDFSPLYNVAATFLDRAKKAFEDFENIDYSKLTQEDVATKLGELLELKASAEKFSKLDDIYLSVTPKDKMNEEEKKVFDGLAKVADSTDRMLERITELQRDFVVQYALKQGFTTEKTKENVLSAEKELEFIAKTFLEGTKLSPKIIRLASNAILKSSSVVALKTNELVAEYTPLVLELEKEAAAQGKSAFDMIGNVEGDELVLIKKIDKKFWNEISKAKDSKDKKFFLENMNKEEYDKFAKEAIDRGIKELELTKFSSDPERDSDIREYRIRKLQDSLDINRESFNGYKGYQFAYIFNRTMKEEDHYSEDYKQMAKNPAALKMWEFYVSLNQKAREMGYIDRKGISFFPLVEATIIDKLAQTKDVKFQAKDLFKDLYTTRDYEDVSFSRTDPETGRLKKSIPKYFTRTSRSVEQLSKDLTKVGTLWIKSLMEYQARTEMENTLLTLHSVEKSKGHIIVENNKIVYDALGDAKVDDSSNKNADVLEKILDDYLYGLTENLDSIGNVALGKVVEAVPGSDKDVKEKRQVNVKKALENSNALTQALAVGLKLAVAIPNYFGVNFHAFINAGGFYRFREFQKRNANVTTGVGLSTIDKALLDTIVPINEDIVQEEQRKLAKKQGYLKYLSSWSLIDIAMVTNSWPERKLQYANALAFNDNTMVVDGNLVNIRQYLRTKDRETKYAKDESGKLIMSNAERRALEKTFEDRVKELQETKSLSKVAKIENDKLVIPGVDQEEIAKYRVKVIEYSRKLNGQMSRDNKADYRRDTILKSFMMFRNWIPKQISERTLDIQKNEQLDEWEYGRVRVFVKTWARLGMFNILKMKHILSGDEQGIEIMNSILEEKRIAYKEKTGKDLEITDEEFYDLMRQELSRTVRELGLLFSTMAVLIAAKAAIPPEDEDPITANKYKFYIKVMSKVQDELSFYYNPLSFESMTRGSVIPGLGIAVRAEKAIADLRKEVQGQLTGDEDLMDKAHPTKRFLDLIPGPSQFQNEFLPLIDPELAKELGIRVSAEARRQ